MYYRIMWCKSKNPLGETGEREEARIENVILWLIANRKRIQKLSAGCSVYQCSDEENALPETIFNWEPNKEKCFGHIKKAGFPPHVFIRNGKIICSRA